MLKVENICGAIEDFAPLALQEGYDNAGLQVGMRNASVNAVMLCLDVTEDVLDEAIERQCTMIVSHHPLIFRGLKSLTGEDETQRIAMKALKAGVAIYSAHTNLDSAWNGVSHEMAHMLGVKDIEVLIPASAGSDDPEGHPAGLGVVGNLNPTPKLEFLRIVKEKFGVKALKYSRQWTGLVVKRVALCGGSGASFIKEAISAGADVYICGDLKYHDFTSYSNDILLADIGHYESELCSMKILSRIMRQKYPELVVYFSEKQKSPIAIM